MITKTDILHRFHHYVDIINIVDYVDVSKEQLAKTWTGIFYLVFQEIKDIENLTDRMDYKKWVENNQNKFVLIATYFLKEYAQLDVDFSA